VVVVGLRYCVAEMDPLLELMRKHEPAAAWGGLQAAQFVTRLSVRYPLPLPHACCMPLCARACRALWRRPTSPPLPLSPSPPRPPRRHPSIIPPPASYLTTALPPPNRLPPPTRPCCRGGAGGRPRRHTRPKCSSAMTPPSSATRGGRERGGCVVGGAWCREGSTPSWCQAQDEQAPPTFSGSGVHRAARVRASEASMQASFRVLTLRLRASANLAHTETPGDTGRHRETPGSRRASASPSTHKWCHTNPREKSVRGGKVRRLHLCVVQTKLK